MDVDQIGPLAQECDRLREERNAARDFARQCWEFIQAGCFGDVAESDIGADGSPERELYIKWCIVRFAVDDGRVDWLKEGQP